MQSDVPSVLNQLACPCNCGDRILKRWGVGGVGGVLVLDIFNFSFLINVYKSAAAYS